MITHPLLSKIRINLQAVEFIVIQIHDCTVNAQVANGGWVPRGPGAATAITPQGGRAPSDQYNPQPSHEPPAPRRRDLRVGKQPGAARGLGAPSHSP